MKLTLRVEIIEDDHVVRHTKKLLRDLGSDVAECVSAHERIESNGVMCKAFYEAEGIAESFYGPELPAKLEQARALLNRVNLERPPDQEWCRDYFLFTGQHMILVDENWEEASSLADYRRDDPSFKPDDEVNAPSQQQA